MASTFSDSRSERRTSWPVPRTTPMTTCHRVRPTTFSSTDRKSTRLNSSHVSISYAVFCLKKKKTLKNELLPVITISNLLLVFLRGGTVSVEQTFSVPWLMHCLYIARLVRSYICMLLLVSL